MSAPPIVNVHTPTSSFAIVHSLTQDSLQSLYDSLTRKPHTSYHGPRVGPGWLKYEFNDSIWNLDDDSDYTIFVWRQQQPSAVPSTSSDSTHLSASPPAPTLHLNDPAQPLPAPPAYRNPAYYVFQSPRAHPPDTNHSPTPSTRSRKSRPPRRAGDHEPDDPSPAHKRAFEKFHAENGVRTVIGSIGPVDNVRMLLKSGYRHVYISRKFAIKHGFIPKDAAPGHYGYGGLVNIGTWPISLTPSRAFSAHLDDAPPEANGKPSAPKPTLIGVYLSEEPHFDVVLGRSFFEKRQIRTSATDPTDVVCLDTGEKVECELVILKDGRGEIVTVT